MDAAIYQRRRASLSWWRFDFPNIDPSGTRDDATLVVDFTRTKSSVMHWANATYGGASIFCDFKSGVYVK